MIGYIAANIEYNVNIANQLVRELLTGNFVHAERFILSEANIVFNVHSFVSELVFDTEFGLEMKEKARLSIDGLRSNLGLDVLCWLACWRMRLVDPTLNKVQPCDSGIESWDNKPAFNILGAKLSLADAKKRADEFSAVYDNRMERIAPALAATSWLHIGDIELKMKPLLTLLV